MAMQILNTQNLILNIQNTIENLIKEKENILNETIPKLNRKLQFDISERIQNLKDKLQLEKLKLTNVSIKNSEIVGNIIVDEDPIKPKKILIIAVAFVTGFILSIFLVFFIEFVNSIKKEEEDNR
ncbi:GNVR domain-containing protein [Halarcobacter anaerophilus]|uniref:GNVR domain-containing protein n=1 Tax=Halarcobacter anaerophilus TaxID=877500 RepID=UPI0012FEC7F2|nr:GNVR domain-containing protein [Halarcobacter anaerophilus]